MIIALLSLALAGERLHPVHEGDTIEGLAAELGDPGLAAEIRSLNGLQATQQPKVGALLRVPDPNVVGEQEAFLISKTGEVTVKEGRAKARSLPTFTPIARGALICTDEEATATVRLASTCNEDGSASDDITMQPASCMMVTSATSSERGRATVVKVTEGSIAVLAQEDARGHVTVLTPSGMTSGPMGGYRVTLEEDAARTETLAGTATVAGSGAEVALEQGQGSRVKKGEAPSPPIDLLRTQDLLSPEDGATLLRPDFEWATVRGALGYRFEMGGGAAFQEVLYQEDVPETTHAPLTLMLPYNQLDAVYWRVASFDRFGFLGVPSEPRKLVFPSALR